MRTILSSGRTHQEKFFSTDIWSLPHHFGSLYIIRMSLLLFLVRVGSIDKGESRRNKGCKRAESFYTSKCKLAMSKCCRHWFGNGNCGKKKGSFLVSIFCRRRKLGEESFKVIYRHEKIFSKNEVSSWKSWENVFPLACLFFMPVFFSFRGWFRQKMPRVIAVDKTTETSYETIFSPMRKSEAKTKCLWLLVRRGELKNKCR